MREFLITAADEGQGLLRYASKIMKKAPIGTLQKALRKGNITINGGKSSASMEIKKGDKVQLWFSEDTLSKFIPEDREKEAPKLKKEELKDFKRHIIYEDRHIVLVNKAAGLLTQSDGSGELCLNDMLLSYYRDGKKGSFNPAAANRLDRNTSGLVLCGLTTKGLQLLSAGLKERSIGKLYRAVVLGNVSKSKELKAFLTKDGDKNEVTVTEEEKGSAIVTRFKPLSHISIKDIELTELEVELVTGKPHQIRAHLLYAGFPVLGDPKYNTEESKKASDMLGLQRQLLHAYKVVFPRYKGEFAALSQKSLEAPLPDDMNRILKYRRG